MDRKAESTNVILKTLFLSKFFPTSSIDVVLFSGELYSFHFRIYLKSEIPEAAKVFIGPALIAFTRISFDPRSLAKYLTLASKACLLYTSDAADE